MNTVFTQKGNTSMRYENNRNNVYSEPRNTRPDKPQFGGCALVVVLLVVAIVLFTVVIPALVK